MDQVIVDCATGQTTCVPYSPDQAASLLAEQSAAAAQAQQDAQASAQRSAFSAVQQQALASVAASLHGTQAATDAAALAGIVHKLVGTPPTPLSATEQAVVTRFMLRCLLP